MHSWSNKAFRELTYGLGSVLADTGKYAAGLFPTLRVLFFGGLKRFDPLDGSSNVDAGIAVGTIFGIFSEEAAGAACDLPTNIKDLDDDQVSCLAATLQPGKNLVAAGYVLYSCSTELVFTIGRGVVGFTLDNSIGEYVLTRPSIKSPELASFATANIDKWDEPFQQYIKITTPQPGGNHVSR
ncbi:Fructose-1,6-bisphosphatase, cytosolic [Symbiodinium microadriaticum]|uniref:Fructose-1,6-bisphosphatase, cytosolic n=1 Tax=Symbiodinium microadriaticum TaxID=2951 RepID=A0A1Q9F6Q2_SYMMI|nr:Fructose-1,6-bisphosphatase, cytosolic [Symbiodinium microadriaticum]